MDRRAIEEMCKGLASYIPGLMRLRRRPAHTGESDSARYCYSIWLRHLVMAHNSGLDCHPRTVAELGPGASLGVGLAAMLTGANRYQAFDVKMHGSLERNLEILDALVELLGRRSAIPDEVEFPAVYPRLASYEFPTQVVTEANLARALRPARIESIRNALQDPSTGGDDEIGILYYAPWHDPKVVKKGSVDMIFSQAVLEHVEDLDHTYRSLRRWLKPGGFMSHTIGFGSHGCASPWNGHWRYSDLTWILMRGRRGTFLNREPHSAHLRYMRETGFRVVCDVRTTNASGIRRMDLTSRFSRMSDQDLATSSGFILAVKPPSR